MARLDTLVQLLHIRRSSVRRLVLTLLLVSVTTPALSELVEWITGATDESPAGGAADDRGAPRHSDAEHGCTPIAHHCGCCSSVAAAPASVAMLARVDAPEPRWMASPLTEFVSRGAPEPPHRPPSAS